MDISTDSPKKAEQSLTLRDGRFLTGVVMSLSWLVFLILPITLGTILGSFFLQLLGFVFGLLVFLAFMVKHKKYEFKVYSADEAHRKVNEIYGKFD